MNLQVGYKYSYSWVKKHHEAPSRVISTVILGLIRTMKLRAGQVVRGVMRQELPRQNCRGLGRGDTDHPRAAGLGP